MSDYDSIKENLLKVLKTYHIEDPDIIKKLYKRYLKNCIDFQQSVKGNLDTFKKAACIREAILECKIMQNEEENDMLAINVSVNLITTPSCYIGENYDHEFQMDSISEELLRKNTFLWEQYLSDDLKAIQFRREYKDPRFEKIIHLDSTAFDLELLYNAALISQRSDKYYEFPIRKNRYMEKLKKRQKRKSKKRFTFKR